METEIPSEVRCSIDGEAASWVIRPEVSNTSLRKSANEHCAPENQHQKNPAVEVVFRFHSVHYSVNWIFRQFVAGNLSRLFKIAFVLGQRVRESNPLSALRVFA